MTTWQEWRLPKSSEWLAAVGNSKYPWGEYYPPHWDDGNFAIGEDGKDDPKKVGVDGILGTAPVGSFKPNVLGFYDLGGNVAEWMLDFSEKRKLEKIFAQRRGQSRFPQAVGVWRSPISCPLTDDHNAFVNPSSAVWSVG